MVGLAALVAVAAMAIRPFVGSKIGSAPSTASSASCRGGGKAMVRNELYFGLARKAAAPVSDSEWAAFVDTEVAPRFPDGLTVVDAYGQWRGSDGQIGRERSKVLIIWHPASAEADGKLEAIRTAYKTRFAQESVMRVDAASCVSF